MTIHQPPRLATWILRRLGSTIIEDALVGDLFEAYQTRRSPFWYWGQVSAAIGVGACRDVWHHLPVALGAIVTGLFVAAVPVWLLQNISAAPLSNVPLPVWTLTLASWLVVFGSALLSGWLISLLFRAHRAAAVLSLAAAILVVGAILLPNAIDLGPLALGSVLLLAVLAAVGGGSLTGVRERTVRE
jgi:hypothetical protein